MFEARIADIYPHSAGKFGNDEPGAVAVSVDVEDFLTHLGWLVVVVGNDFALRRLVSGSGLIQVWAGQM